MGEFIKFIVYSITNLFKWFFEPYKSEDLERIIGDFQALKPEIEGRLEAARKGVNPKEEPPPWINSTAKLLKVTDDYIRFRKIDIAWKCLKAAKRAVMRTNTNVEAEHDAVILRREADKIGGWRKKSILDLVGAPIEGQPKVIDYRIIQKASEIRDEYYDNLWLKIKIRQGNLKILFFIILATVFSFPLLSWLDILSSTAADPKVMLVMAVAGILGATFSAAITLTKRSVSDPIPDQVAGAVVTYMRPAIGAAAALIVYFLIKAGITTEVLKFTFDSTAKQISIGFIAGFSERLVVNVMGTFTGEK